VTYDNKVTLHNKTIHGDSVVHDIDLIHLVTQMVTDDDKVVYGKVTHDDKVTRVKVN
jgi:hypothetical protein